MTPIAECGGAELFEEADISIGFGRAGQLDRVPLFGFGKAGDEGRFRPGGAGAKPCIDGERVSRRGIADLDRGGGNSLPGPIEGSPGLRRRSGRCGQFRFLLKQPHFAPALNPIEGKPECFQLREPQLTMPARSFKRRKVSSTGETSPGF